MGDASQHLIGRLASVIAKQLLNGQHVTVVRCERLEQTGSHIRNKFKFLSFIRKKTNTNPKRGPFHHRSPAKVFKRCVRGMLPKKRKRGYCALARLKTFVGCPAPYDKKKKLIVPDALRIPPPTIPQILEPRQDLFPTRLEAWRSHRGSRRQA